MGMESESLPEKDPVGTPEGRARLGGHVGKRRKEGKEKGFTQNLRQWSTLSFPVCQHNSPSVMGEEAAWSLVTLDLACFI